MFRKNQDEEGFARMTAWALRNRAQALRDEIASPWRLGGSAPEAAVGRWLGLGLAVGALVAGVSLALIATLSED
jgi:hypothetical protein